MASSESAAALQQQLAALTAVLQAAMSTSTAANGAATQHAAALPREPCFQGCRQLHAAGAPLRLETTSETVKMSDEERDQLQAGLQRIAELDEQIDGLQRGFEEATSLPASSRQSVRSTRSVLSGANSNRRFSRS